MNVIVELRQYTLRPGARDTLVDLFEREFVTGQEAAGITVGGRFRDLDDADRFVWLRSFPDMAARARALHAFYHGTVWQAHRERANATMLDSDNVLLLRGPGFAALDTAGPVAATICPPGPYGLRRPLRAAPTPRAGCRRDPRTGGTPLRARGEHLRKPGLFLDK